MSFDVIRRGMKTHPDDMTVGDQSRDAMYGVID